MRGPRVEPGTVLAEKYRLDALLGEGGMGTVYRATHLLLKAPVAIKVIDREVADGDVALARFMREAQAAASLRSPNVVQVLDYGTDEGIPYMVMELLEGESLAERLTRMGTLTPRDTYRVINHVARAVARAHEAGIIHRDLKPDNVFLVHNEGDEVAKVLDFGVAKMGATALGEGSHTRTGSLLGTPYYMSPEQAQGNKEVDYRSDLWALGVIAFECLTGRRPFFSDGLGEIVLQICIRDIPKPSDYAAVSPGFDDWFARATEREPSGRFQSARELSEALRGALDLQRETEGSVPDAVGSTASAPPGKGATPPPPSASAAATTERDQTGAPLPPELGGPHVVVGERGARWEESREPPAPTPSPPDAQWAVVPRGPSERPGALADTDRAPAMRSHVRTGWGLFWVAVAAVVVGAAVVLAAREYGTDFLLRTLRGGSGPTRPRLLSPREPKPASSAPSTDAPAQTPGTPGASAPAPGQPTAASPAHSPPGAGATLEQQVPPPVREEDALDALEADLPLPKPKPELKPEPKPDAPTPSPATAPNPPAPASPDPSPSTPTPAQPPADDPSPQLPDALKPPPPPPPPAPAP